LQRKAFSARGSAGNVVDASAARYIARVQDGLLIKRLCAGDDSALAEVFDCYGPLVLGLARRVTGNQSAAGDVLQEVFTALWCHPERFDPERGTLRAYLGVLAHRRAVDVVRASVRPGPGPRQRPSRADRSRRRQLDIPLQGRGVSRARPGARFDGHVVVDSAAFCRVLANRADRRRSGAVVSQDLQVAELLLRGAAALALD
jgi:RNA polymerase sigma factor (sigma-70 family)